MGYPIPGTAGLQRHRFTNKGSCESPLTKEKSGNPDPANYRVQRRFEHGGNLLIEAIYLDCINYEGRKLMIYQDCTIDDLMKQGSLDPHFSSDADTKSPFMRLEPTEEGWRFGMMILKAWPLFKSMRPLNPFEEK